MGRLSSCAISLKKSFLYHRLPLKIIKNSRGLRFSKVWVDFACYDRMNFEMIRLTHCERTNLQMSRRICDSGLSLLRIYVALSCTRCDKNFLLPCQTQKMNDGVR